VNKVTNSEVLTEATLGSHGGIVELVRPVKQVVPGLEGDEGAPAPEMSDSVGLGDDPRGGVRDSNIQDLSRPHNIIQGPHDLLNRGPELPGVNLQGGSRVRLNPECERQSVLTKLRRGDPCSQRRVF